MKHTRLSLFVFFYPQIDYLLKTQVCTSLHPGVQSRWQNLSRPWQGSLQDLPGTLTHLSALAAESGWRAFFNLKEREVTETNNAVLFLFPPEKYLKQISQQI